MNQPEADGIRGDRAPEEAPTADEQAREMAERHRRAVEAGEIPGENEAMKDLWWVKGERIQDTSKENGSEAT